MATFGNTGTTVADVVVQYCGDIVCGLYTLTETANISKLSVFGRSGAGGTTALRGAIFANNKGALGALQGVSSEVIADYNGGVQKWWDMTLALTGLTAAQYWLLLLYGTENGTQFGLVCDEGGPGVYYKVNFWTYDAEDDPPSPGGAVSLGGANLNPRIYATYTTPSGLSIPLLNHLLLGD